ncbi:hypothetical protein COCNU_06G007130 [Cocos nucifera]|uniref:Tetrahydrofolate dehydrogenase/cyclohydrolase NAD(P)-binding domain-containing protein n=1 Tax=Cocos nucifera TaxID=13894 RepID=A0A8K0N2Y5_COCNU|nr:hypothetical protein COCNU_06G007130 [Cocos nucifera]
MAMRALVSRINRELAATPRPSLALKSLGSRFSHHHHDSPTKKEKKRSYILGPDLPDIWNPPGSTPPSPPPSQIPVDFELIPTIINGKSIAEEIRSGIAKEHMNEEKILNAVSLEKDVDGFHPLNMGNLALRDREPLFIPCAAKACIELLLRSGVDLMGKNVAVIGRSKVVGLPLSLLLQRHHATVSIIHAFTKNPEDITREADIVISAAGVAHLVRRSWLKKGTIVIDVGTNPIEDPSSEHGYCLLGDVCYEEALQAVSAITPVPGGVGPVTIAMLLSNTLDSAKRAYGLS